MSAHNVVMPMPPDDVQQNIANALKAAKEDDDDDSEEDRESAPDVDSDSHFIRMEKLQEHVSQIKADNVNLESEFKVSSSR